MLKVGRFYIVFLLFGISSVQGQSIYQDLSDSIKVLDLLDATKTIKSNRDSVFMLATEALKISESIKFDKGIALSKDKMVGYFHAKSDYENAVALSLEVIDAFKRLDMMEESLFQQLTLSTIYKHMGAERGTVDYLIQGLDLAKDSELKSEKLGLSIVLIESLNNQGIILRDLSYIQDKPYLLDSALIKYEKALELLKKSEENL